MMANVIRKMRCGGRPVTAIVLAGGRSRRMRTDKAGLAVGGGTLLEHVLAQIAPLFDEVLISRSPGQELPRVRGATERSTSVTRSRRSAARPAFAVIVDEVPGRGPMAGVLAGLRAAAHDVCAVIAVDIPDVHIPFLRRLVRAAATAEISVPVTSGGQFEPLFAVYNKAVIPKIEALLESGERSLLPLYKKCRTAKVPLEKASWLLNLNTLADYKGFIRGRTKLSR